MRLIFCIAAGSAIFAAVLVGGCSKSASPQPDAAAPTNLADSVDGELAKSPRIPNADAPDGVTTARGMKPYPWPKNLAALPLGQKVRYRNTEYYVMAFLEDKDASIHVMRNDDVVCKLSIGDGGQFGIFDVNAPMPVLEGWGERFDGLFCRWLLVPIRDGGRLQYELSYGEVYTSDRSRALSPEPHQVQLRPAAKTTTVYFLGYITTTTQENAAQRLKEALSIP
jgi:hypothetical protein